jgi:hypothetical protein
VITMFYGHLDVKKEFLFGMPVFSLEHAMLWQPTLDAPTHARCVVPELVTPSWSWTGWEGGVTYGSHNPSFSLVDEWIIGDTDGRARRISTRRHLQKSLDPPDMVRYLGPSDASLVEEGDSLKPGTLH